MKKENKFQSHGSIRKLKAYGAVGVLSIGMMTTFGTVSAKAEEVTGTAIVATTATSTEVTQGQVDQAQAQVDTSKVINQVRIKLFLKQGQPITYCFQ